MRCGALIRVPTQADPVQCVRELGHDDTPGDRMHHGTDAGPGNIQRSWVTGKAGDGRA